MSSLMTDPQAPPPGSFVDPATGQVTQLGQSVVPAGQRITRNPMLPQHPLGAYTDAQYEAAVAQLRAQTQQKYNDVLRQLGYTDDQGNFVMGSAETDAAQKKSEASYQEDLERQRVTNEMQQAGTLFSGYRGEEQGRRTMPYEQTKAQIGIDLPNALSSLYEQANGVMSDFVNQHNMLLADAASRAAQAAINNPGAGGGTDAGGASAGAGPVVPGGGVIDPVTGTTTNSAGMPTNTSYADLGLTPDAIPAGHPLNPAAQISNALPPQATNIGGGFAAPPMSRNDLLAAAAQKKPTPAPAFDPQAIAAAAGGSNIRSFGLQG